jgi:hypothetical protein
VDFISNFKTMKTKCLMLMLILAGAAARSSTPEYRTDINPALLYYQAFLAAPEPLSNKDGDYLYSRDGLGQPLPARFAKIVAGYDPQFALVRQAAACTVPCDWGIDMSRGPMTLLPHLARCKAVAQATKLRVMWELQRNHQAEARDDLLAGFALARNASRDGTLIALLVQFASESIHCATIAENFGRFSPETLRQLVSGLDAPPARPTIAAMMAREKTSFLDWFVNKVLDLQKENPGNDAKVMAEIHNLIAPMESNESGERKIWEPLVRAAGGTSAGILQVLHEEGLLYQRLSQILALPKSEYAAQQKQFSAEVQASPNPLVAASFPAFEKARLREFRIEVWLAMVRAAAQYRLNGEAGFQSVADPFGQGPFQFQSFQFEGVDRGFALKSAYDGSGFPEVLIFVDKEGPAFRVDGPHVGESLPVAGRDK